MRAFTDFENIVIIEYELEQIFHKVQNRYKSINKPSIMQSLSRAITEVAKTKHEIIQNYNNQSHQHEGQAQPESSTKDPQKDLVDMT